MAIALLKDRIRHVREVLKLTQKQFAEKLEMSQSYMSEVETGQTQPGVSLLISLNTIFKVSVDWLLTGEGSMFPPVTTHFGGRGRMFPGGKAPPPGEEPSPPTQEEIDRMGIMDKICDLVDAMETEEIRDILKYLEKEELFKALLKERTQKVKDKG